MKTQFLIIAVIFACNVVFSQNHEARVKITDIKNNSGNILYAVYNNAKTFNDEENFVLSGSFSAQKGTITFTLKNLPAGEYAISVLHDENNNKKLDTNILGIPKEGFGFSKNPRVTFSEPGFDETKFMLNKNKDITINMKYFL